MSSRNEILASLRRGLRRGEASEAQQEAVRQRLQHHPRTLIPARGQQPGEARVELFIRMAREAAAEVVVLASIEQLPAAVAQTLASEGERELVVADDERLAALDWNTPDGPIRCHRRVARVGDRASLTPAFAGIAETGTLLLYSRPESPTSLNFLPDTHLVLLRREDLVGVYEEGWDRLRAVCGERLPRSVNLITGPSRSADIEQKLQLGAHGPRRLVIYLVG
jgi:L-lactate dehydrogenase complex protein LldG